MKKIGFLIVGFITTQFALANNNNPVLSGSVQDGDTKKPLAEVTVKAIHTINKTEHIVITDALGIYKFPQLPAGAYHIKISKENYNNIEKRNVQLNPQQPTKLNFDLYEGEDPNVHPKEFMLNFFNIF